MKIFLLLFIIFLLAGFIYLFNEKNDDEDLFIIKEIKDIYVWQDGGSVGFLVEDNRGQEFKFCFDRRMGIEPGNPRRRNIFINASHPDDDGALGLDIASLEEKKIIKGLSDWLVSNYSQEELLRLSEIDTVIGLSEEELKPFRVIRIIGWPNL